MGYRGFAASLSKGIAAAALGLILAAGSTAPGNAQAISPGERLVDRVDFIDADLAQAIQALKAQTGIEIVIESSDKPYKSVTLSLNKRPLVEVLRIMCEAANASFREEGGIFVISPRDARPKVVELPVKAAPAPVVPKRTKTEKIRLVNTRPTEILYYFGIDQRDLAGEARNERGTVNIDPYRNVPKAGTPNIQNLGGGSGNIGPIPAQQVPPVVPVQGASPLQNGGDEAYQGFGGGRGGGGLGGAGLGG